MKKVFGKPGVECLRNSGDRTYISGLLQGAAWALEHMGRPDLAAPFERHAEMPGVWGDEDAEQLCDTVEEVEFLCDGSPRPFFEDLDKIKAAIKSLPDLKLAEDLDVGRF